MYQFYHFVSKIVVTLHIAGKRFPAQKDLEGFPPRSLELRFKAYAKGCIISAQTNRYSPGSEFFL